MYVKNNFDLSGIHAPVNMHYYYMGFVLQKIGHFMQMIGYVLLCILILRLCFR